jgi:hypothetical protein
MPYDIKRNYGDCEGYAVVGPEGTKGCHSSRKEAIQQQRALYAAELDSKKSDGIITNEDVPQPYPHSLEDCSDSENCKYHKDDMDKKSPCWDGYVQRGMKRKNGRMVPNCVPVKKTDVNWQEGVFIMGPISDGMVHGKIEHVMKDGSLGTGSEFEIQATLEDPALLIRMYKETDSKWEETEFLVGIKSSEAVVVGSEQDMQQHSMSKSCCPDNLEKASLEDLNLRPTDSMASNAKRGLELRRKFGRGGTSVGVARARDLANKKELSPDTVLRMYSFFSRHEVDKKGKDWNNSERPSNGKIAWLLWGGDSGYAWARSKRNAIMRIRSQKSSDPVWYGSAFELNKIVDNDF